MPKKQPNRPKFIHNHGYGLLFSYREYIQELIECFVAPELAAELDFSRFKADREKHYITADYVEYAEDLVVEVGFRGRSAYIYVLVEFQSKPDRFMALRLLNYLTLFYLDWLKENPRQTHLPPVLPIVLYSGGRNWQAPERFRELLQPHPLLETWAPEFRYFLLRERAIPDEKLQEIANAVATVFKLEKTPREQMEDLTATLRRYSRNETSARAKALLWVWVRQLFLAGRVPESILTKVEHISNQQEADTMLVDTIKKVKAQWRREGRAEGEAKGLAKGKAEGEAKGLAKGRAETIHAMIKHGMAMEQIADILEISIADVRRVVSRARK